MSGYCGGYRSCLLTFSIGRKPGTHMQVLGLAQKHRPQSRRYLTSQPFLFLSHATSTRGDNLSMSSVCADDVLARLIGLALAMRAFALTCLTDAVSDAGYTCASVSQFEWKLPQLSPRPQQHMNGHSTDKYLMQLPLRGMPVLAESVAFRHPSLSEWKAPQKWSCIRR